MIDLVQATLNGLKEMSQEEIDNLSELMRYDSKMFVKVCFPEIISSNWTDEKKIRFIKGQLKDAEIFPPHHLEMYKAYDEWIDGDVSYLCFVLFRKAAKTSLKRFIATKIVCYHLTNVMMFVSETFQQAKEDIDSIKYYIEMNPIIKYLFGNMKGGTWNKEEAEFKTEEGETTYIITKSVGSRMRGILHRDFRVGFTFCDEFESKDNTYTITQRQLVLDTIQNEVLHVGDGNFKHKLLFQNTIVHPEAFTARAKYDERFTGERGRYIEYPISYTPSITWDPRIKKHMIDAPQMFQAGVPVWPDTLGLEYLEHNIKIFANNNDGRDFWMLLQEWWNIPRIDSKALFNIDKITKLDATFKSIAGINFIERMIDGTLHKIPCDVYLGVDPASGRNDNTDHTVVMVLGVLPDGKRIMIDSYIGIIEFEDQVKTIFKFIKKFNPRTVMIESVNYQYSLYSVVKKQAQKDHISATIKDFNTQKSKNNKFKESLTMLVNNGNLLYITECSNVEIILREFAHFNREDDKDDAVDGVYLAELCCNGRLPRNTDVNTLIRTKSQANDIYSRAQQQIEARRQSNQKWDKLFKESMP